MFCISNASSYCSAGSCAVVHAWWLRSCVAIDSVRTSTQTQNSLDYLITVTFLNAFIFSRKVTFNSVVFADTLINSSAAKQVCNWLSLHHQTPFRACFRTYPFTHDGTSQLQKTAEKPWIFIQIQAQVKYNMHKVTHKHTKQFLSPYLECWEWQTVHLRHSKAWAKVSAVRAEI